MTAYRFCLQDPAAANTVYLFEEVVAQLTHASATRFDALFGFASRHGVVSLLQDDAFSALMGNGGTARLLVGLDFITDRRALEVLDWSNSEYAGLEVYVIKDGHAGIFHPKVVSVTRSDGSGAVLVGSGNLTPGGFRENIEAFSVYEYEAGAAPDFSAWDQFFTDHASEISHIDDEAYELGDRNAARASVARRAARRVRGPGRRKLPPESLEEGALETDPAPSISDVVGPDPVGDRVLLAEVPKAGGRWQQGHFNADVVRDYFRVQPHSMQRLFQFHWTATGLVREPPRRCVLSGVNKNHRIELGARQGEPYPTAGRPVFISHETGVRQHVYMVLMPGEPGYSEAVTLMNSLPSLGRGLHRSITDYGSLRAAWPSVPI